VKARRRPSTGQKRRIDMKAEATKKPVKYILPDGETLLLKVGVPVVLPDSQIQELVRKAPGYVTVHFESWHEYPHDDQAPVQPGSYIEFYREGRLVGGPEDGDVGRIVKALYHDGQWRFFTEGKLIVPEASVVSVSNGHSCWTTRQHGLSGTGRRTIPMRALTAGQRHAPQDRYHLSDGLSDAMATGSSQLWDEFWRGA